MYLTRLSDIYTILDIVVLADHLSPISHVQSWVGQPFWNLQFWYFELPCTNTKAKYINSVVTVVPPDSLVHFYLWCTACDFHVCVVRRRCKWLTSSQCVMYLFLVYAAVNDRQNIHSVPKLATPLQISWCKIVNTWQIFTKCETFMETSILS